MSFNQNDQKQTNGQNNQPNKQNAENQQQRGVGWTWARSAVSFFSNCRIPL